MLQDQPLEVASARYAHQRHVQRLSSGILQKALASQRHLSEEGLWAQRVQDEPLAVGGLAHDFLAGGPWSSPKELHGSLCVSGGADAFLEGRVTRRGRVSSVRKNTVQTTN